MAIGTLVAVKDLGMGKLSSFLGVAPTVVTSSSLSQVSSPEWTKEGWTWWRSRVACGEEGDRTHEQGLKGCTLRIEGGATSQGLRQLPKAEEGQETLLPFQTLGGTSLAAILIQAQGKSISDIYTANVCCVSHGVCWERQPALQTGLWWDSVSRSHGAQTPILSLTESVPFKRRFSDLEADFEASLGCL